MVGEENAHDEARESFKKLRARILRIEDEERRREALEHLKRMEELLGIQGE